MVPGLQITGWNYIRADPRIMQNRLVSGPVGEHALAGPDNVLLSDLAFDDTEESNARTADLLRSRGGSGEGKAQDDAIAFAGGVVYVPVAIGNGCDISF